MPEYLTVHHDAWVVAASWGIAVMASFVALELVRHERRGGGLHAWAWLLGGSAALGTGIWSMHFMGMLALTLPIPLGYDVGLTALSWAEAVAASAVALGLTTGRHALSRTKLVLGSAMTALGICAMHYTGMAALALAPGIVWQPELVAASVAVAWAASLVALRLFCWHRRLPGHRRRQQLLAAMAMGAATSGMHYTGMAAALVPSDAVCTSLDGLGGQGLPVLLMVTVVGLLALTLLASLHDKAVRLARQLAAANDGLQLELTQRRQALRTLRGSLEVASTPAPGQEQDDLDVVTREVAALVARQRLVHSKLEAILSLSPDGFVSFNRDGTVVHVSPAFMTLTGLRREAVLGLDDTEFTTLLQTLCLPGTGIGSLATLRQPGGAPPRLLTLRAASPRTLAVQLFEDDTGPIRSVVFLRDVTRELEVERLKTEFVTTAAHELRTPMASIYGYVELIRQRELSPQRRAQTLDIVLRQARLMTCIVDDLLDLSRLQSRSASDLDLRELDLSELAREAAECVFLPSGRSAPVVVVPGTPALLQGDRNRLLRVLVNLLSNAYKFSPLGGEVRVTVEPASGADAPCWQIIVRDEGIGMSATELARVGERFWRADASGHVPGTGLGVSIVREILALHGGTLQFHSVSGQGTCATVTLPCHLMEMDGSNSRTEVNPPGGSARIEP